MRGKQASKNSSSVAAAGFASGLGVRKRGNVRGRSLASKVLSMLLSLVLVAGLTPTVALATKDAPSGAEGAENVESVDETSGENVTSGGEGESPSSDPSVPPSSESSDSSSTEPLESASEDQHKDAASSDGAVNLAAAVAQAKEDLTATSEEAGVPEAVEGQALVLYRVSEEDDAGTSASTEMRARRSASAFSLGSEGGNGSLESTHETDLLSEGADASDAAPLTQLGFSVQATWDFSTVDQVVQDDADLSDGEEAVGRFARSVEPTKDDPATDSAGATGAGVSASSIPEGDDVRVALVQADGLSTDDLVAQLEDLPFVEAAQPNYVISVSADAPNDPLYRNWQYAFRNPTLGIDLQAALNAATSSGSEDNIVAVIDTGVDSSHPDLAGNMWSKPESLSMLPGKAGSCGYDFADNDDDPTPPSGYLMSHGTHCAGNIAAVTNNGEGMAGGSQHTKIMAMKCATDISNGTLVVSALVYSYQYIVAAKLAGENVVAVNNSWTAGNYYPVLDYLVNQAGKAGVISFFAAGNSFNDAGTNDDLKATAGLESPYAIVVAASNEQNKLASFSNWNVVDVDLAAPGGTIMSTVGVDNATSLFNASVSKDAGRDLEYFEEFTADPNTYTVSLISYVSGDTYTNPAGATLQNVTDKYGHSALGVEIDLAEIPERLDISQLQLNITWNIDNPFKDSQLSASDYAISVTPAVEPLQGIAESSVASLMMTAFPYLRSGDEFLVNPDDTSTTTTNDQYACSGASVTALDTKADQLTAVVSVGFAVLGTTVPEGSKVSFTLSGFGVGQVTGQDSAYVPYYFMHGTSMATPVLTGAFAQLAAMYPNETPLELRGRIVGSTVSVNPTTDYAGNPRETATDGRFSFDVALKDADISANTWSVTADTQARTATLHGYALGDASVTFDGSPVKVLSQNGDQVVVQLPDGDGVFDGTRHSFYVTDASTGKTHKAAYVLPLVSEDSGAEDGTAGQDGVALQKVMDLPVLEYGAGEGSGESGSGSDATTSIDPSMGAIVASSDRVFYANTLGDYLFSCADPSVENASWTQLSAPGVPWQNGESTLGNLRTSLSFAYRDGTLYAFAVSAVPVEDTDNGIPQCQAVAYVNRYDILTDTWSGYQALGAGSSFAINAGNLYGQPKAVQVNGTVYFIVSYGVSGAGTSSGARMEALLFWCNPGESAFQSVLVTDKELGNRGVMGLAATADEVLVLTTDGDSTMLGVRSFDPQTQTWSDETSIANIPYGANETDRLDDFIQMEKV